jgi:plastocyanin
MANHFVLLGAIVAAGLLFAIAAITLSIPLGAAQPSGNNANSGTSVNGEQGNGTGKGMMMTNNNGNNDQSPSYYYRIENKYHEYKDGQFIVRAGGGGAAAPLTWFFPRHAEIKVGETVMWINPTKVGEPHTVTFMTDPNLHADFAGPFILSSANATLTSAIPNANAEAVITPGPNGTNIVVAANKRSMTPTVIDFIRNVTELPPNANYAMVGTEKYVNSGWIWPHGQVPSGFPPIDSFSIKFTRAGTYNYMCEIHPWMTGEVIVK